MLTFVIYFFYETKSTALPIGIFDKGWKQFYERYTKKMLTVVLRYLYIIHLKILILNSSIVIDRNKLDSFQPSSSSRFPAYRNYKTRVLSFGEIMSTETIGNLAAFGFFYEGKNFRVYILVEIYCFDDATKNMQNQVIINRYFMLQEWTWKRLVFTVVVKKAIGPNKTTFWKRICL